MTELDNVDRPANMALMERHGPVAVVTLNFPRRRNALCLQMRQQLKELLETICNDEEIRAIVLRGAGSHFCSGGDISEMKKRTILEARFSFELAVALFRILAAGPKPIVAAVDGSAIGAGLSIATLADYVIATPSARFGAAFVQMGLMADLGGLWGITQRVGYSKAREILGLGRSFGGQEALRIGLANEISDPGKLEKRALEVAGEYAALPPMANALLRNAFARGIGSVEQVVDTELNLATALSASQDHQEAAAAFLEKRKPIFKGR